MTKHQLMIMQKNIQTAKTKTILGSTVWVLLLVLLACSLVFPHSSNAQTEVVTGQETSPNYIPEMGDHTRSGSTLHNQGTGTSKGCKSGNFCTGGKQGPGGTYSSTFDLEENMTIDQINRGFSMDYGMDVDSHQSNLTVPSCANGNTLQNNDCKDIFTLTVKLFDGTVQKHSFQHTVELDYNGVRNFSFSQTIPQNTYSSLTGEFDMFGIDAGFGNKFFGPAFSAPFLTTTFDLVTLIETEVIDIINNTDIISDNTPDDVQVDTIEVEVETPDGQQMASLELEVNTEMTLEMEMPAMEMPAPTQEVQVEVAEVSAEIETEMNNVVEPEPTADQPVESSTDSGTDTQNESNQESESTTEGESGSQEGESQGEVNEQNTSSEESQETETASDGESQEESNNNAGPNRVADSKKTETSSNKGTSKDKGSKKTVVKPKKSAKQKAANKIVKKMGDKGRYDSTNQLKTLVIMNVLTDTKKFLVQPNIPQPTGFFTDTKMPDAQLPENNAAAWMLMGGSNQLHDRLTGLQYKEK